MSRTLTCIVCPLGCDLFAVTESKSKSITIEGAKCSRGESYGLQEMTNPQRTLQSSVKVVNGQLPLVSVKTSGMIPKSMLLQVMEEINTIECVAPIRIGQIIVENILDLGVDLLATKTVEV